MKSLLTFLIVIGYADHHENFAEKIGIGSYTYLSGIAAETEMQLAMTLKKNGLRQVSNDTIQTWKSVDGFKEVTLVNANFICPSEDPMADQITRRYNGECKEQRHASAVASRFVRENLMKYDAVIYVGHSRYGSGLGLGNFNDNSNKIDLSSLTKGYQNPANRLKFLMVSSCDSYRHYRNAMGSNIKFLGLKNEDALWLGQMLPAAQDILSRLLNESDLIERFSLKSVYD